MRTTNSALRAELGNCLRGLVGALDAFNAHIQLDARDAWIWQPSTNEKADALSQSAPDLPREQTLDAIAIAIRDIKYKDGQDPHESRIAPGIVVVSEEGIPLADEVNRQKTTLARVLKDMEGRTEAGVIDPQTGERGSRPLREVALEAFNFRRLHYWQATRELVVLRQHPEFIGTPDYIGFSWMTPRDVRRTFREQVIEQLEQLSRELGSSEPLSSDLATLHDLPENEPLAWVRPGHTSPRANLSWPATGDIEGRRTSKPAVLPLVMLGPRIPLRFRRLPPAPAPKHYRLARSDTEIEARPLLATLPIHRYLPHVVESKRRENDHKKPAPPIHPDPAFASTAAGVGDSIDTVEP